MCMKPRTWALLSVLFFVAAAVCWRLAEERRVRNSPPAPQVRPKPADRSGRQPAPNLNGLLTWDRLKDHLQPAAPDAGVPDPKKLYPHRVSNTRAPFERLMHSDSAILLRNALIDTRAGRPTGIPEHLRAAGEPGAYLVQARWEADETFQRGLRNAGAELVSYIPHNTWLVRASPAVAARLESAGGVRAVLPWEPFYKLDGLLLDLAVKQNAMPEEAVLRLTLFPGTTIKAVEALHDLNVSVLQTDRSPFGPQLLVLPPRDKLVEIARLPQVQLVEAHRRRVLLNDVTRPRVGLATNTVVATNHLGLTGTNILVAVVDTCVDTNTPNLAPRVVANTVINTFSNRSIAAFTTQQFSIFIPDCSAEFQVELLTNIYSGTTTLPGIEIYASTNANPSTNAANLVSTNLAAVNSSHPQWTNGVVWYYDLVNTNAATVFFDLQTRVYDAYDPDGHGTFVAGIIGGSGATSPGATPVGSVAGANFRGVAPAVNIFSVRLGSYGGGYSPSTQPSLDRSFDGVGGEPGTISDTMLQEVAARTNMFLYGRTNKPVIVNNSWGYDPGFRFTGQASGGIFEYDSTSASYDAAVRDGLPGLSGEQAMIYVFAAGNRGGGDNSGGGGLAGTVVAPANAKNVIAVGQVENRRDSSTNGTTAGITNLIIRPDGAGGFTTNAEWQGITDSSNQVWAGSSRGNVGIFQEGTFGRFKPDVVAPGTFMVSLTSPSWDQVSYYNPLDVDTYTFTNFTLAAGGTNSDQFFVPVNATNFSVSLINRSGGVDLWLFTNQTTFPPSTVAANFAGTNAFNIAIGAAGTGLWYFDVVNTNTIAVDYDVVIQTISTNNFGNYFQVLSNLNQAIGPDYRYEPSGTSFSAPVVSGLLALMQQFFEQGMTGDGLARTNSPALMKALLINGSRSLSANYGLQVTNFLNLQGWGMPDIRYILPPRLVTEPAPANWPVQFFDQHSTNAIGTGERHVRRVQLSQFATNFPLRVTLVWTDPPGNPAASIKLVNDLDLLVSNRVSGVVYHGNHFPGGGDFSEVNIGGTNNVTDTDIVNNIENVYINGPDTDYDVYVVGKRVYVNAVAGRTNGIGQDYALVISSGEPNLPAGGLTIDQLPTKTTNSLPLVTVIGGTNALLVPNLRVGANDPFLTSTNGQTNQWVFFVITNSPSVSTAAFVTFLPPNLSRTRQQSADIDLYVSRDSNLTNLDATVISNCFAMVGQNAVSTNRGGTEYIVFTNGSVAGDWYVGIKSEDQQAAEFGFFAAFVDTPFARRNSDGSVDLFPINIGTFGVPIPDGTPDLPGVTNVVFLNPTEPINIRRVVVTNYLVYHDLWGDMVASLSHNTTEVILHSHDYYPDLFPGPNGGTNVTSVFDDSGQGDIPNAIATAGPTSLQDFGGQDGIGLWQLTVQDNALTHTGQIGSVMIHLDPSNTNNIVGRGGLGSGSATNRISLGDGGIYYDVVTVPVGAISLAINIRFVGGSSAPLDLYVRRGAFPDLNPPPLYDYYASIGLPGGSLVITRGDTPPLAPGRYFILIQNNSGAQADFDLSYDIEVDVTADLPVSFSTTNITYLTDFGRTNGWASRINVNVGGNPQVASIRLGARIDHERAADLSMYLVSPVGTRLLVFENRGSTNTYGIGMGTNLTELAFMVLTDDTNTARTFIKYATNKAFIDFIPPVLLYTNYLEDASFSIPSNNVTGGSAGNVTTFSVSGGETLTIDWMFYVAQDRMIVTNFGGVIYDSGCTNNTNGAWAFDGTAVDAANDILTITTHGFTNDQKVGFMPQGSPLNWGVSQGVVYYVEVINADSFYLHPVASSDPAWASGAGAGGGSRVNLSSAGGAGNNYAVLPWITVTVGPLAAGTVDIAMNAPGCGGGTLWNYYYTLSSAGSVTYHDQSARAAVVQDGSLYLSGVTDGRGTNGIVARLGLPLFTNSNDNIVPIYSLNWANSAGGTRFNGIAGETGQGIYVVGKNTSETFDADVAGPGDPKGIVVKFPLDRPLVNVGLPYGENWHSQAPPDNTSPGTSPEADYEELHAVAIGTEYDTNGVATNFLYVTGNAQFDTAGGNPGRLVLSKLETNGTVVWTTNDFVAGVTNLSSGRAIVVADTNIFVAGVTNDGTQWLSYLVCFDTNGNTIWSTNGLPGQYNGLATFNGELYAVGVTATGATNGSGANFVIDRWDRNGNLLWTTNYDLGDEDVLYDVLPFGDRLYVVGSTVTAGGDRDAALLEIDMLTGALITHNGASTGVFTFDAGQNQDDAAYSVATDGFDLYVVGEGRRYSPAVRTDSDVLILRYQIKNDYFPEEPLTPLLGQSANGNWLLEVWDNREGATNNPPRLLGWNLQFQFASTGQQAIPLTHGVEVTNTIRTITNSAGVGTNQAVYYVVNVPFTANFATNTLNLVTTDGTGQLELWYNQTGFPTFGGAGDVLLLNAVTTGTAILRTPSGSPNLIPGQPYYLAVRSSNLGESNTFRLLVEFDQTATTFSSMNSPTPGALSAAGTSSGGGSGGGGASASSYLGTFQFVIPSTAASASFNLKNLTGNVSVLLRRGAAPNSSTSDFAAAFSNTNAGSILIQTNANLPAISGTWYARIENQSDVPITFDVVVRGPNQAPVFGPFAPPVINEGSVFSFTPPVTDPEGDGIVFTLESGPPGSSISAATGTIQWPTGEAEGPGAYAFTVRATDNFFVDPKSAALSFTLTVNEVNAPPFLSVPANQAINELTTLNVSASATDADVPANALVFSLVNPPAGMTIDPSTGAIAWTPTEAQGPGSYTVTVRVADNGSPPASTTKTFNVAVSEVNAAPSFPAIGSRNVDEHSSFSLSLAATDPDLPVQTLTFGLISGPPGMALNGSQLTWTPDESYGGTTQTVTVRVTDNGVPNLGVTQSFDIVVNEVNSPPLIISPGNQSVNELAALSVTNQAVDGDTPAQTLTFSLVSGPSGASVDASTGVLTWTPTESQGPGAYTVKVKVEDNGSPAKASTNNFTVTVNEVNSAPVLASPGDRTVYEHQLLSLALSATDSDVPANTLSYGLVSGPAGMTVTGGGTLSWTPAETNGGGDYAVKVRVFDNGTPSLSATQTFNVSVLESNAAPVLAGPADRTVVEGQMLSLTLSATDSDLPAQNLTYSFVSGPAGVSVTPAGLLTWTTGESDGGSAYSIVVKVTDDGSPPQSDSKLFVVTVTDTNSPPVFAAPGDQSVNEHETLTLNLSASDPDVPAQNLAFTLLSGPSGLNVTGAGLLTWTPGESHGGSNHTVVVRVSDDGTPSLSATQAFTVTVTEVNAAPALQPVVNQAMDECATLDLLMIASDTDLPAQSLAFSLGAGAPAGASIDATSGLFTFRDPSGGGVHTISVIVADNGTPSLSATQTFTVTVNVLPTNVVALAEGVAASGTNTACKQFKTAYKFTVPSGTPKALFELFDLSGDADLLLRRGAHPTASAFDFRSASGGATNEQVVVVTNATFADLGGEWFLIVKNNEPGEVSFKVNASLPQVVEGGTILVSADPITINAAPVITESNTPQIQWSTVAGEKYQVEVSSDLVNWTVLTNIVVTGPNSTFTDPTPYTDNQQRFYRIRQVPQ